MNKILLLLAVILLTFSCQQGKKEKTEDNQQETEKKYQAKAPPTQSFGKEAFEESDSTTLRWLGMSGFLVNSRGTTIMIDPLLGDFDMPILIEFPIKASEVPRLDGILVTHSDNDHYSIPTCEDLKSVTKEFHSTNYVDSLMKNQGLPSFGHNIGGSFNIGELKITLTPVDHAWQNENTEFAEGRHWKQGDASGFWIETPD